MPRTRNQMRADSTVGAGEQMALQKKRTASEGIVGVAPPAKRTAFGDITNAIQNVVIDSSKRIRAVATKKPSAPTNSTKQPKRNSAEPASLSASAVSAAPLSSVCEERDTVSTQSAPESLKKDGDSCGLTQLRSSFSSTNDDTSIAQAAAQQGTCSSSSAEKTEAELAEYDRENIEDPFSVPHYAFDIFQYYRKRETKFRVEDYMQKKKQSHISKEMRAVLVDWMVEIQENFELNHETLYQSVKMLDLYLDRESVTKDDLQLVGATALFIASKFDERQPPCLDDFLYICDDAYTRDHLLTMEMQMLVRLQFDIGMPLSYRYIRRYAKATKADMKTLTLGRYILERSLMFYDFVTDSEAEIAAGALLLALRMLQPDNAQLKWTSKHELYSGVTAECAESMVHRLNRILHVDPPAKNLNSVQTKYSHSVFFEVALVSPLPIKKSDVSS